MNAMYAGPICMAQDGGGGYLMIAYGKWDYVLNRPVALPLAASDLLRDQTAAHGVSLLQRAMKRAGIRDESVVASTSDGTDHAVQESEGNMEPAHESAQAAGHRVGKEQLGMAEFCCIHGKSLEEVNGMMAAFPREFLVNSARLLWEIVGSPIESGGRLDEYHKYWIEPVARKDGVVLPGLPAAFFDQNMLPMMEPTSAKWQVSSRCVLVACRVPCAVCRAPCPVPRAPCPVRRAPCAVRHVPCAVLSTSSSRAHRVPITCSGDARLVRLRRATS